MTDELHPLPNSTTDAEAQKINPLEVSVQLANEERYLDAFTKLVWCPSSETGRSYKRHVNQIRC